MSPLTPRKPSLGALPSIDSLRCFCAAAEQLNFRRAAAQVGLTPTAFSERIRGLESELASSLFTRTTRRMALTPAGEALRPAAERALAAVQACLGAVQTQNAPIALRVGTRFELGLSWLLPATMALERARPELKLDLYFGSGEDILERLDRGLLDAVVTSAPVARSDWHAEVLHPESYELVASARLLARVPFRSFEDAKQHILLDLDETLPLTRYLLSAVPRLEFAGFRACGAGAALLSRVLAGDGIAVLPSYMIKSERKSKQLRRLLPKVQLLSDSFRLLYKKSARFPDALRDVANFLRTRPLC